MSAEGRTGKTMGSSLRFFYPQNKFNPDAPVRLTSYFLHGKIFVRGMLKSLHPKIEKNR